ncbi:MAG: hypothetical protein P8N51_08545 [Pseudomonadales bacterium]|nr:hypothetical protein [Pseudomonadales bacterium]MDG1443018.1 hypothetical protein [Pseudomonadales bacterium]
MLSATEFYEIPRSLEIVLWIEVVVYLGIGIFELFDDFIVKPRPWMTINGRVNGYIRIKDTVGHKMHAGICFLLGFIALNGLLEGHVTRFELELIFVSFAILMPVIIASLLPGRLTMVILLTKPEFWLQGVMFFSFSDLIRPEVLFLCVGLNLWGVVVYAFHTRKNLFKPFTYAAVRADCLDAEGEAFTSKIDKMAGYKVTSERAN